MPQITRGCQQILLIPHFRSRRVAVPISHARAPGLAGRVSQIRTTLNLSGARSASLNSISRVTNGPFRPGLESGRFPMVTRRFWSQLTQPVLRAASVTVRLPRSVQSVQQSPSIGFPDSPNILATPLPNSTVIVCTATNLYWSDTVLADRASWYR